MASEMRRSAKALVEHRSESFDSRHGLEESQARLAAALRKAGIANLAQFNATWRSDNGRTILEAHFSPSPRTQRFLKIASLVMLLLVASCFWALGSADEDRALKFLLPMFTVLAILGFPFVALGLASQREAEEARIRKAIRVALLDED
jgi:predicted membrane-bound mannosyltransferase